jgi:NitT/TauT family transport system permease protein
VSDISKAGANTNVFKPVVFRGGGFAPRPRGWVGLIVFVSLILMLEVLTRTGIITSLTMPIPSDVFWTFIELWQSGMLFKHLVPSLSRLVVGAVIGCSVGICVGIVIGLFSLARAGLVPLVAAIFPIPKIALLPLFVIWFGIDETSKYALIAFGTFTPTVVATYGAVDNVDRTLIRMGQSYSMSWLSIVRKIVLPGAMPGILSGLRIGHCDYSSGCRRDAGRRIWDWCLYSSGRLSVRSRKTVCRGCDPIRHGGPGQWSNRTARKDFAEMARVMLIAKNTGPNGNLER